jgi:uncharacterized membrane protein YdbT with pleckstrin-like domain
MTPAGDATASVPQAPAITQVALEDGEIIILTIKPNGITVLLRSLPVLIISGALLVALILFEAIAGQVNASHQNLLLLACSIAAGLQVVSAGLRWLGSLYILTNLRVIHLRGLVSPNTTSCCLTEIDEVSVTHSSLDRPFGLGSLNFSAESNHGHPHSEPGHTARQPVGPPWINISRPYEIAGEIRKAIHHAHNNGQRQ